MDIKFNKDVAYKIGINEAVLLHYLCRACRDGRLIERTRDDGKTSLRRSFQRASNYRYDKQHLKTGFRYKRISMNVIHWWLPWISVPTIRNTIYRLEVLDLIDVKHADRIINDNTNCYAVNNVAIKNLIHDCMKHARPKPKNERSRRLHRFYTYQRSKIDPNIKPIVNDDGVQTGVLHDTFKPRWKL